MTLTQVGRHLAKESEQIMLATLGRLEAAFTPEEMEQFMNLLFKATKEPFRRKLLLKNDRFEPDSILHIYYGIVLKGASKHEDYYFHGQRRRRQNECGGCDGIETGKTRKADACSQHRCRA
ncbi:hypothetical protein LJK87_03460 [Paenibacillus sp. P25]|nr:hypothetical protein LJK87_03460 [Paenibacillus sp. P25]